MNVDDAPARPRLAWSEAVGLGSTCTVAEVGRETQPRASRTTSVTVTSRATPRAGKTRSVAAEAGAEGAPSLAVQAQVKLGSVLSVQETLAATNSETNVQAQMVMAMYGIRSSGGKEDLRVTSDKFAEIPVRVNLQVRFAIDKKE